MQVMLMRLMSKGEYLIVPKRTKFKGSGKLGLSGKECKSIYAMPFKVILNSKLRWLHFRITHEILPTNSRLCKIKVLDDNLCNFCNQEEETLDYLFTTCMGCGRIFR